MSDYRLIQPNAPSTRRAATLRAGIVAARFNDELVSQLIEGAQEAWKRHGGAPGQLTIARVPGAFELPLAAKRFAQSGRFDCLVALGCVIRGDTPHFEYVAGEAARGILDAGLTTGVPIAFGVLTVANESQARERAAPGRGNKGGEAIETAIEMALLLRSL